MDDAIRKFIVQEVERKMATVAATASATADGQNRLLAMQVSRIQRVEETLRGLYRNGSSGPPGFIEMAHEQNSERLQGLSEKLDDVCSQMARDEGKDELLVQQKAETVAAQKLNEELSLSRAQRWKHYVGILAVLSSLIGGAWGGPLVRPVIKAFFIVVAKAIQ